MKLNQLQGVAVLRRDTSSGRLNGRGYSEQQIVRRMLKNNVYTPKTKPTSPEGKLALEKNQIKIFLASIDLAGIALHASTKGYDYSKMLLPCVGGNNQSVSPVNMLKEHDNLIDQYLRSRQRARLDAVEYSEAAYQYEFSNEVRGLKEAFFSRSDTKMLDTEVLEVTLPTTEGYSRIGENGNEHATFVKVYTVYNDTLLPTEVPYDKALLRWKEVLESMERQNEEHVFPMGNSFWAEALNFEYANLALASPPVLAMRRAEDLSKETGLSDKVHRERVAECERHRSEMRELENKSQQLFLDAARRERQCIRSALRRAGWSATTESVGLPAGGFCGSKIRIDAALNSGHCNVPVPDVCNRDLVRFPWPPRRGAGSLKYALGTWRASRTDSGCWVRAQADYAYVSDEPESGSDSCSEHDDYDLDLSKPLDPNIRDVINRFQRHCRACCLPRTTSTNLKWYMHRVISAFSTTSPTAKRTLNDMIAPVGSISGWVAATELLVHIMERADEPEFVRICTSIRILATVHEHTRNTCARLFARIRAIQEARLEQQQRLDGSRSPLLKFFEESSEDSLHCIIQHLEINDILGLLLSSRTLSKEAVLQQALPNIAWIPYTQPWTPPPGNKSPVHRQGAVVGVPLAFGRTRGNANSFVSLSHSHFFGHETPPQISVELLFDSPSLQPVPHDASGPPCRYSAVPFQESDTMNLPSATITTGSDSSAMPAVKFMCLSSSFHGAFAAEIENEIAEIQTRLQNGCAGPRSQARLQQLREMGRRNAKSQHFVLKCTIRCHSSETGSGPVFETVSPPFVVVSRLSSKRRYTGVDGPGMRTTVV